MAEKAILDGEEGRDLMRAVKSPVCAICDNWDVGEQTCEAFPERIPDAIFIYGDPHAKPFPGDNGIRFEAIDKEPEKSP